MQVTDVFINKFRRLRSGWRFTIFVFAFLFSAGIAAVAVGSIMTAAFGSDVSDLILLPATDLSALLVALLVGWLLGRYIEGVPFRTLGAVPQGRWFVHLITGLGIGIGSLLVAVIVAYVGGGLRFSINTAFGPELLRSLAVSGSVLFVAAAFEEALFRGYILQTFARSGLAWFAVTITACFFGFVHLNNPNSGAISTVNTMLAGVWLGAAYLRTRDLWFPFGLHFAWNWMQGPFFGIEVSGMKAMSAGSVLAEYDSGPSWLTGGDYGIEAGVACTVALALSTALIYLLPWLKTDEDLMALTSSESERQRT